MEFEKALAANVMTDEYWKRELRSQDQIILKSQSVAIWVPNRVFEKSESRGEISKENSPLRFYEPLVSELNGSTSKLACFRHPTIVH
ncbi:hypothetical protein [Tunturibacter empetritectus]|uniref:Uncharacterized protein n=1 Tax=Tunturiibacter empetritectus TaxID=3069691 RepID=A0A7W8MS84_9BACT|nr:hypothetical protein [Edaphobacter lichenicola]MBB5318087.1 hypothetical protein [Edaphobacter lichenicola]